MQLFESILVLLVLAVILLQVSKHFRLPYPSLLALAGIAVAAIPFLPTIKLDPGLALAIFVTPALFDAAYGTSPKDLKRHWQSLAILAIAAVILTTLVVSVVGHYMGHLGWAAALTLGAIVSPPDASAVTAVLNRFPLPRRTLRLLEGESLLNDATALLLFGTAESIALHGTSLTWRALAPFAIAIPGGALLGYVLGVIFLFVARWTAGTLSGSIAEISITFGAWILSEKLHVSPILAVVVLAITIARKTPRQESPRDRVHSTALWGSLVFILSTLAFLLLGMQVLDVSTQLSGASLRAAVYFAVAVLGITVLVRLGWVYLYRVAVERPLATVDSPLQPARFTFLTGWCGIRGILTIATASALPHAFPGRVIIVFTSFAVVLGTLVLQGFTLGPLVHFLRIEEDNSFKQEADRVRNQLLQTGLSAIADRSDAAAAGVRKELEIAHRQVGTLDFFAKSSGIDKVRLTVVDAQRNRLIELRDSGDIEEDVFRSLQEELDWATLAASPADDLTLEEV